VRRALIMLAVAALGALLATAPASASAGIVLSTTYPSIVTDRGKEITFPVDVSNQSSVFREIALGIAEGPADWNPDLRDRGFSIRSVMLGPGKSQSVQFSATPPETAKPGGYAFVVRAVVDGVTASELRLAVTLRDAVSSGLALSTQFPNVRGQAGSTFSFTFDLTNKAGMDRDVGVSASAPSAWEVTFKPQYDTKQVSSFRVRAGEKQAVDVSVATPSKVGAGRYAVTIVATAGTDKAEVPLEITIVGKSAIAFTSADGRLNTRATVDQDSKLSFVLKNTGGAPLESIRFSSSPPDGWTVTFQPETVDTLAPDQQQDVTAVIHPGPRALAGDYMVSLTASASGTSASQDIRVTVETPTAWGLVGVVAILAVLGGLGAVFTRYARR